MAKAFYTSGTGSQQTLSEIESDKIPVYNSVAEVDADLSNLEENQIIATEEDEAVENGTQYPVNVVEKNNMHAVTSNAVAGALSYSTEEIATGGKWIDGKPIYRKVFVATENKTISSAVTVNGWSEVFSIDKLVQSFICNSDNTLIIGNAILSRYIKNENRFYFFVPTGSWDVTAGDTFTFEYTKTTD